jgi:hypothetical protein
MPTNNRNVEKAPIKKYFITVSIELLFFTLHIIIKKYKVMLNDSKTNTNKNKSKDTKKTTNKKKIKI